MLRWIFHNLINVCLNFGSFLSIQKLSELDKTLRINGIKIQWSGGSVIVQIFGFFAIFFAVTYIILYIWTYRFSVFALPYHCWLRTCTLQVLSYPLYQSLKSRTYENLQALFSGQADTDRTFSTQSMPYAELKLEVLYKPLEQQGSL